MPITRNGMVLASLKRGTSQIAFVFQGTVQIWAHEIVFMLGASSAAAYLVDIVSARPGLWATSTPKRVVVPAGVERGSGTSWVLAVMPAGSSAASSWAGKLTLEVRGTLSGIGGAPNSGKGGDVIWVNFPGRNGEKLQINVLAGGLVRAGGGGGGRAGNGGTGVWYSGRTITEYGPTPGNSSTGFIYSSQTNIWWYNSHIAQVSGGPTVYTAGGWTYYRWTLWYSNDGTYYYNAYRQTVVYDVPNYTSGGVAGNAGRGQGFDGAAALGANAVAGGTNAGASGKSGNGGAYGTAGQTGANGSNGNYTGGTAGAAGGLAGFYLTGASNSNLSNTGGTLLGRLAS